MNDNESELSVLELIPTIGSYPRAEKRRKVLMMKAAKLDLAGPGAGQKQGTVQDEERQVRRMLL